MALYIRDPEVDRLVAEVQRLTKTATKTEAVKNALRKQIEAANADVPLIERIKALQERAAALGFVHDPNFDMKAFMDEMWDDM
jgi:antitoxin VapB